MSTKWDECDKLDKVSQKTSSPPQIHRFPITEKFMDKHLPWMFFSSFRLPVPLPLDSCFFHLHPPEWKMPFISFSFEKKSLLSPKKTNLKWLAGKFQPFHDDKKRPYLKMVIFPATSPHCASGPSGVELLRPGRAGGVPGSMVSKWGPGSKWLKIKWGHWGEISP